MFEYATTSAHAPSSDDTATTGGSEPVLDGYLQGIGRVPRLSPAEERRALERLERLRGERWRALLSSPEMIGSVLAYVRASLDDDVAQAARLDATALERDPQGVSEHLVRVGRGLGDRMRPWLDARAEAGGSAWLGTASYLRRVRRADDRYLRERNRFVAANLRLVVTMAARYGRNRMRLADRIQEGNLGLLKALERFDVRRGTRFSTYAAWWIRHYVTRALVNRGREIRLPAQIHRTFMKARRAAPELAHRLGRPATIVELAETVGVTPERLAKAQHAMSCHPIGLDTPVEGADTRTVADVLAADDAPAVDTMVDEREQISTALDALEDLDPKLRDILDHRFGLRDRDTCTLKALGDRYGVSRERIRQLQNRALGRLRAAIEQGRPLAGERGRPTSG